MQYLVTVKPGSSQEKVVETQPAANTTSPNVPQPATAQPSESAPAELTVYLRAKPHDGEANAALIKLLAKHFKVPKTTIKILRGAKSRQKLIEI